jgi:hypothetical protein
MRKLILIAAIALFIPDVCIPQQVNDNVLLGQLYGTQPFGFFESLRGKVKEFRQTNYLATEENGKAVKIRILTTEDRKTAPSGRDYFEEYNSSGTILKNGVLDENGRLLEYWDVDTDSGKILSAAYYTNDILRANIKTRYNGNQLEEVIYFLPGSDVQTKRVLIQYDQNGNRIKYQFFNNRNEPNGHNEYIYDDKGNLEILRGYSRTGQMNAIYKYTYNDRGERMTEHQEIYTDGNIRDYRFEYEYDKTGNYVKKIYIKDNKPLIYRERQIKYFD